MKCKYVKFVLTMFPSAVNVNLSIPITCLNRYFSLVRMSIGLDRFHCIYVALLGFTSSTGDTYSVIIFVEPSNTKRARTKKKPDEDEDSLDLLVEGMDYEDEIDAAAEAALLADQGQTNLASNFYQEPITPNAQSPQGQITPNAQSPQGQICQTQQGEEDLPSLQTNLLFEEETTAPGQGQATHAASSSLQGQTIQMEPANSSQGQTTSTTTTTVISKCYFIMN